MQTAARTDGPQTLESKNDVGGDEVMCPCLSLLFVKESQLINSKTKKASQHQQRDAPQ
jgi:hypothetical protein